MARCSASYGLGFACFALAVAMASAAQFTVGGAHGWSVPPAGAESLNAWAMKNRFQIGDKLLFVYPSDQDSVLLVEPSEYNTCNTSSYDKKFTDGNTVFTLDRSGAFFFISGVDANCRANEKLIVMVLAAGRNGTAPAPSTTPPSSPLPAAGTAPPPSAPPPASPSPPPPASPAPTTASPPPPPAPAPATRANTPPPTSQSPPAAPPSTPPSAPAGAPPPPASASSPAPGTPGNNNGTTTGTKPPSAGNNNHQRNGAGAAVSAGLVSSAGACVVGFAMLAL